MNAMPEKFSQFVRMVADDVEKTTLMPRFKINMFRWFETDDNDKEVCWVCAAGCFALHEMGISTPNEMNKALETEPYRSFLSSADYMRTGDWRSAYRHFNHAINPGTEVPVPDGLSDDGKYFGGRPRTYRVDSDWSVEDLLTELRTQAEYLESIGQ